MQRLDVMTFSLLHSNYRHDRPAVLLDCVSFTLLLSLHDTVCSQWYSVILPLRLISRLTFSQIRFQYSLMGKKIIYVLEKSTSPNVYPSAGTGATLVVLVAVIDSKNRKMLSY